MNDQMLAGVVWRLTNPGERDRREVDDTMGRLAAGRSRPLWRILRAISRT